MVFRGKPSKACERCRARRLRVSLNSSDTSEFRFDSDGSVTFRVVLVASVSEPMLYAQDIEIRSNFGSKMKANQLRGEH
jgi:hypothetical protein